MLITTVRPARAFAQQLQHIELMMRVEMIDRLVEQQHFGILREQCRERGAATFAAGQRVDIALREIVECDSSAALVRDGAIGVAFPAPEVDVRMTADEHAVEHRRRKRILGRLREQTELARECAARPVRERLAIERDVPRAGARRPRACATSASCPRHCGRESR
jgi:hypothetical protein